MLLVLAVDMPAMIAEFLRSLLEESQRTAMGVIPSVAADGRRRANFEPLAAVYPHAALALADECLRIGERKLEIFIHKLETGQFVSVRSVVENDAALFTNWNAPPRSSVAGFNRFLLSRGDRSCALNTILNCLRSS